MATKVTRGKTVAKPAAKTTKAAKGGSFADFIAQIRAELKSDPSLKIPATGTAVVKARTQGLRWERVAIYAGITVKAARELYEAKTGESYTTSYSGKGRNFTAAPAAPKVKAATKTGRKPAASKPAAKPATKTRLRRRAPNPS